MDDESSAEKDRDDKFWSEPSRAVEEDVSKLSFEEVLRRTNLMEDSDTDIGAYHDKLREFREKNGREPTWAESVGMRSECRLPDD